MDELKKTLSELDKVNNKIEAVEAELEQVAADLTACEILCFVCYVNTVCVCLSSTAKRGKESGTAFPTELT